ncbi:MAG: hypothetical protein CVU12_00600 [Bacteroidetes bacterium HGW-Bacteroidetes-7]|jgi:uncharacterized protein (TIGR02145 family)|nr:MAG: hypothetical protein CVU12_00600 [Bacteroidetes bacterium HGW-Bacteroidetes-7]
MVKTKLIVVVLFITLFSCIKDEVMPLLVDDGTVQFICEDAQPATKTTLNGLQTEWVANTDKVGIFSPQASKTIGGNPGVVNEPLTALSNGARSQFSGTVYWNTGDHIFYSYYPYAVGTPPHTAVPVSLPANQTQSLGNNSDHLGALDFLVAKPHTSKYPGVSGAPATVSLRYNHLFAIIEFQIIRSTGSGAISKVKLNGKVPLAFEAGTINLAQNTPASGVSYGIDGMTNTSNIVIVSLGTAITPTTDYSTTPKVYMVVLPGTHIGELKIGLESGSIFREVKKSDVTFERGKKYVIKIDAAGAEIPVIKGSDLEPVTIGNLIWSPVNLGYSETLPMGELFQWHRNYGFGLSLTSALRANDLWSIDLDQETALDKYRETFLSHASDPYDWMPIRHTEWNQSRKFNPCPDGWRVPTKSDYSALLTYGNTTIPSPTGGGVDGLLGKWIGPNHNNEDLRTTTAIFLPVTGIFGQNSTTGNNRANLDSYARYWASTTSSTNNKSGDCVIFTSSVSSPTLTYIGKSNAYAIRCVKDVTPQSAPLLYTIKPYEIKLDGAKVGGNIEYQGSHPITERGVFYGTAIDPATNKIIAPTAGIGEFIVDLTGLNELTSYFVRAYAKNSAGTIFYSDQFKFAPFYSYIENYGGQEVTINGVTWAPWNAGYDNINYQHGLLYQWHRKYGQSYSESPAPTKQASTATLDNGNKYINRNIFYAPTSSSNSYDWCSSKQSSWSTSSEYNPCPIGWGVPTVADFQSLISAGSTWASGPHGQMGRWFGGNHSTDRAGSVFFPASGLRDTNFGIGQRGIEGHYWTSEVNSTMASYLLITSSNTLIPNTNKSYGLSLRCVKK